MEKLNKKVNPKENIYLSSWILEVDKIAGQKLGAWGWEGFEVRRDGEREGGREDWGELGGMGWLRWRKGRYRSREEDILI